MSDAGNKVTFSTAIKADKKTKERQEATKILHRERAKANSEAKKKRINKKINNKKESVGEAQTPLKM